MFALYEHCEVRNPRGQRVLAYYEPKLVQRTRNLSLIDLALQYVAETVDNISVPAFRWRHSYDFAIDDFFYLVANSGILSHSS